MGPGGYTNTGTDKGTDTNTNMDTNIDLPLPLPLPQTRRSPTPPTHLEVLALEVVVLLVFACPWDKFILDATLVQVF